MTAACWCWPAKTQHVVVSGLHLNKNPTAESLAYLNDKNVQRLDRRRSELLRTVPRREHQRSEALTKKREQHLKQIIGKQKVHHTSKDSAPAARAPWQPVCLRTAQHLKAKPAAYTYQRVVYSFT